MKQSLNILLKGTNWAKKAEQKKRTKWAKKGRAILNFNFPCDYNSKMVTSSYRME